MKKILMAVILTPMMFVGCISRCFEAAEDGGNSSGQKIYGNYTIMEVLPRNAFMEEEVASELVASLQQKITPDAKCEYRIPVRLIIECDERKEDDAVGVLGLFTLTLIPYCERINYTIKVTAEVLDDNGSTCYQESSESKFSEYFFVSMFPFGLLPASWYESSYIKVGTGPYDEKDEREHRNYFCSRVEEPIVAVLNRDFYMAASGCYARVVEKRLAQKREKEAAAKAAREKELQRQQALAKAEQEKAQKEAAFARLQSMSDPIARSQAALRALDSLKQHLEDKSQFDYVFKGLRLPTEFDECDRIVALLTKDDLSKCAETILAECENRIHFGGFYVGMPLKEFCIMKAYNGVSPNLLGKEYLSFADVTMQYCYASMRKLIFPRKTRYALFEKEDGEFWPAFLKSCVPRKTEKKTLGQAIEAVSDSLNGGWDYETEIESGEARYILKSIKYKTKVTYSKGSGKLILERFCE